MNKKNNCTISNISKEHRLFVDRVIESCQKLFSDSLIALYLAGSLPRGNFVQGKSDVDFYAILRKDGLELSEIHIRDALDIIEKDWKELGISTLDLSIKSIEQLKTRADRRTTFSINSDSILISGESLDLEYVEPADELELAIMLNEKAKIRLEKIKNRLKQGISQEKDMNRLAKLALRCAYGIALIRGADYTPLYNCYPEIIKDKVPEIFNHITYILENTATCDYPNDSLVKSAELVLAYAENNGINFVETEQ